MLVLFIIRLSALEVKKKSGVVTAGQQVDLTVTQSIFDITPVIIIIFFLHLLLLIKVLFFNVSEKILVHYTFNQHLVLYSVSVFPSASDS